MNSFRIKWIDIAKGICMLSVIAGHMEGWPIVKQVVYSFHLSIFFFLSGYTLKGELNRNIVHMKFIRLMKPYFLTCIAVTIMDIINYSISVKHIDFEILSQILLIDYLRSFYASGINTTFGIVDIGTRIGAIWFLPATFFAVIIIQLILKYINSRTQRWVLVVLLALLGYFSAQLIWLPFSIQSSLLALPVVLIGYETRKYSSLEKLNLLHFIICLTLFILGLLTGKTKIYYANASMDSLLLSPIFAVSSSVCVIYISKKMKNGKILSWIGRNSIYFLCIHLFELETMATWFKKIQTILHMESNIVFLFGLKLLFISLTIWGIKYVKRFMCAHNMTRSSSN